MRFKPILLTLTSLLLLNSAVAWGQAVLSNTQNVTLNLSVTQSMTISVSPSSVTLPSTGAASPAITVTANWNTTTTGSFLSVDAYFSSATAALQGIGVNNKIPASAVFLSVNGNTASACNGTDTAHVAAATAGATCQSAIFIAATATNVGTATNPVTVSIPSLPGGTIPADTYTGTLIFSGAYN